MNLINVKIFRVKKTLKIFIIIVKVIIMKLIYEGVQIRSEFYYFNPCLGPGLINRGSKIH